MTTVMKIQNNFLLSDAEKSKLGGAIKYCDIIFPDFLDDVLFG